MEGKNAPQFNYMRPKSPAMANKLSVTDINDANFIAQVNPEFGDLQRLKHRMQAKDGQNDGM